MRQRLLGAWLAKEYVRDVYLTEHPNEAAELLDRVIAGCLADEVAEIVSLGNTAPRSRPSGGGPLPRRGGREPCAAGCRTSC